MTVLVSMHIPLAETHPWLFLTDHLGLSLKSDHVLARSLFCWPDALAPLILLSHFKVRNRHFLTLFYS